VQASLNHDFLGQGHFDAALLLNKITDAEEF
jgi:hypothetical protein